MKKMVSGACLLVLLILGMLASGCPAKVVTQADVDQMKEDVLTAKLKEYRLWNMQNATDPAYALAYYWDPQSEVSRKNLREFIYCLSDPNFHGQDSVAVVMYAKGKEKEMWPVLTEIFRSLEKDVPDLEKFLKTIRWQAYSENSLEADMPPDDQLPWFAFFTWENNRLEVILSTPVAELPAWMRETTINYNTIDAIIELAKEKNKG